MVWKGNNLIVSQKGIRKKFLIREIQAISSNYRGSNKLLNQDIKGKYYKEREWGIHSKGHTKEMERRKEDMEKERKIERIRVER